MDSHAILMCLLMGFAFVLDIFDGIPHLLFYWLPMHFGHLLFSKISLILMLMLLTMQMFLIRLKPIQL